MYAVVLAPWQVVLVVRVEVPDRASPWAKENQDLVDRILTSFPGTVDYSTAIAYSQAYLVGLYHCADVLVHAPTQEVGIRSPCPSSSSSSSTVACHVLALGCMLCLHCRCWYLGYCCS